MQIDEVDDRLIAAEQEIAALKATVASLQGGTTADPLVDAWREVGKALDEIQAGLTREQSVQALLDAATRIRG